MREYDGTLLLAQLPEGEKRWGSFATGMGVQTLMVVLMATVTFTAPQVIQKSYDRVELVAPTVEVKTPRMKIKPAPRIVAPSKARLKEIAPPPTAIHLPALPKQELASVTSPPVLRMPQQPAPKFDAPVVERPSTPKVVVQTNVFGSSAQVTLNKPAREVQTGGFGDPSGVKPSANGSDKSRLAAVGSFDLPAGGGQGNGTGGTHGARGTVASSGFGNGIAAEPARGSGGQGRVQMASFGTAAAAPEAPRRRVVEDVPAAIPVSIQSKPQPVYTAEARQARVEGEVLVQVLFGADGRVKVQRVLRGLGHGLDEAAARAAEGIRFIPAQRNGQAVDSSATLHIVFQLS